MKAALVLQMQAKATHSLLRIATTLKLCPLYVQADLVASLQARMDIVMAEAEGSEGSSDAVDAHHPLLMPAAHATANVTIPMPCQLSFSAQPVNFLRLCILLPP